jgi:CubicO group peptidase (beta-lactamase class C family)
MTSRKSLPVIWLSFILALSGLKLDCLGTGFYQTKQEWFKKATPEAVGLNAEDVNKLADSVKELVSENKIIGGEILLIKKRKIVLHKTYGMSDRERKISLSKNSIYRIRSMTKPFIGTLILMLEEQGKLKLDDLVSKYLPSYKNDRSGEITIRHLITHTSGFKQDEFPQGYWESGSLRKAIDLVGRQGPPMPVGEKYIYSDKNSAAMGAIIAEITGEPVEKYIQTKILDPLGMKDTFMHFSPDYPWAPRMNSTYRIRGKSIFKYWDNTREQSVPFFRASGGIHTTVLDYARFLSVWMDLGKFENSRLLKEENIKRALRQTDHYEYGFHWEVFGKQEESGGLPPFGHGGSDGTFAIAIPDKDVMILYFTQTRGTPTIRRNILPLIKELYFD